MRQAFIPALGAVLRGSVIVVLGLLPQPLAPIIGVTSALAQATSEHERERAIAPSAISLGRSDSIVRRFVAREHIPGLAVAVGREGGTVWENAYGFADLENHLWGWDWRLGTLAGNSRLGPMQSGPLACSKVEQLCFSCTRESGL